MTLHRAKRDRQVDYRNAVLNSGKEKLRKGIIKIKDALSPKQQKEIKRKALLEARPNILAQAEDEEIEYEMGFTREQA